MERLTDKRVCGPYFYIPKSKEERRELIKMEKPSLNEVLNRLCEIENILGDDYDLEWLRDLIKAVNEKRVFIFPVPLGTYLYRIVNGRSSKDKRFFVIRRIQASWFNIRDIKKEYGKTVFPEVKQASEVVEAMNNEGVRNSGSDVR